MSEVAEIKGAIDKVGTAFEEFKKTNDQNLTKRDALLDEKLDRINNDLNKYEDLNQKMVQSAKAQEAVQEQLDQMNALLNRPGMGGEQRKAEEVNQFVNKWARAVVNAHTAGVPNLPEEQRAALDDVRKRYASLNVTDDSAGGYLAPEEFVREIIKGVTEQTPVRQLARLRTTTFKTLEIPKRTGQFAAKRVQEQGSRNETNGLKYGLEEMSLPEMYAVIDISQQMLEDSAFDMEAELREESLEQFAVKEGQEFVSGTGVGEMEGILTNKDVAETVSGAAATITADGLLTLKYGIKTAYARNGTFLLNRSSLGSVRKLKDDQGQYLWMPGLAMGQPNTIDGDPYVEAPDMPNEGANAFPVAYGDFRRGYTIGDRIAMSMMRDPYTQAANGNVRFWFRRRVGGQVTLAEAIRKLKCATS